MQNTHKPYLIQRIMLKSGQDNAAKGVDRHFYFDYMGSAEFEFGALPKALKNMRAAQLIGKPKRIKHSDGHIVWYVGPRNMYDTAKELFFGQLKDPYVARLKERSKIQDKFGLGYHPESQRWVDSLVGWWDIQSTYAFFCTKTAANKWLECLNRSGA